MTQAVAELLDRMDSHPIFSTYPIYFSGGTALSTYFDHRVSYDLDFVRTVNTHTVETIDDVWALREMLNAKAKEIAQKYDYRYSQLIYVFLRLYDDGYLSVEELCRLGDKYEEIDKFFKLRKEHAS